MGRIFQRKQFSDYLGENRAILDIVTNYTQNPLCPEQITVYDADPGLGGSIMNRLFDYSGGTLTSVYCNSYNDSVPENYTAWTRNVQIGGYNYPAWGGSGTTFPSYYYYLAWDTQYNGWVYFRMIDSNRPIYSGMTSPLPISYTAIYTGTTFVGDTAYPILENPILATQNGMWSDPCPSPSPTPTPSPSPAVVTATPTPTVTPTPSSTPQSYWNLGAGFDNEVQFVNVIDGDYYFAGRFNAYDSTITRGVAKTNSSGIIDPTFVGRRTLSTQICYGVVEYDSNDLILYGAWNNGYDGFTNANRFVRISKSTGAAVGFTGTTFNNEVYEIIQTTSGKKIAYGTFTTYTGGTYDKLLRFNSDWTPDNTFWNTAANIGSTPNKILENTNGNYVLGGGFTTYQGVAQNRIVEVDSTTGAKTALFGTGSNRTIRDMVQDSLGNYYIIFDSNTPTFNGVACTQPIIKVDSAGNAVPTATWGAGAGFFGTTPSSMYLDETNGHIYIIGAQGVQIPRRLNLSDGSIDTSWTNQQQSTLGFITSIGTENVYVDGSGKTILAQGFTIIQNQSYGRMIRLNPDGTTNTLT